MILHFTKMEGCGNDYVYVDAVAEREVLLKLSSEEKEELVRRLSDRHFGVGGDGVIFIHPAQNSDFEMEMYNADGSRGEMCGNGIRCVGKYVFDHGMTGGSRTFTVESFGVPRYLTVTETGDDGKAAVLRVNMGHPILVPGDIPVLPENSMGADGAAHTTGYSDGPEGSGPGMLVDWPIVTPSGEYRITCVSMGNPHAVTFVDDVDSLEIEKIGPGFEHHPMFPNRTNTEFVQVIDRRHVKMRVWERGTGETLACGTGCCATGAACILNGKTEESLFVDVPGGRIGIEWDRKEDMIYMTGPARTVFEGTVDISGILK